MPIDYLFIFEKINFICTRNRTQAIFFMKSYQLRPELQYYCVALQMDLHNITLFCAMKATQLHLFCRSVCLDTLTKISHKSLNYNEQYNLYCLGKKIRRLLVQFQINRKLLSPGSLKRLTRTEPAILHLLKNKSHSFTWNCTFVEYFCISKFFWFVLNSVWDAVSCFYEENENNETR